MDSAKDKIDKWFAEVKRRATDPEFLTRQVVNLTVALICAGVKVVLDQAEVMPFFLTFLATTILAVEVAVYLASDEEARKKMVLAILNPVLIALEARVGLPAFLDPSQSQGSQSQRPDSTHPATKVD